MTENPAAPHDGLKRGYLGKDAVRGGLKGIIWNSLLVLAILVVAA